MDKVQVRERLRTNIALPYFTCTHDYLILLSPDCMSLRHNRYKMTPLNTGGHKVWIQGGKACRVLQETPEQTQSTKAKEGKLPSKDIKGSLGEWLGQWRMKRHIKG